MFKVEGDFRSAGLLFTGSEWDTCAYHSQQAAEKSLKAMLCELDIDVSKHI
ncbi:HEPN domain-containing protein [Paenibacillus alginolyticus]|uniref:HEPN domain-containing protein n=1 Tax=Paenibacillus alginolyticus TaxID=59839 RepID=UPI0034DADA56